jgi:D-alanine-D-alanine ligase
LLKRGLERLTMRDKRVGVLLGGLSAERDVSLKTGQAVYEALVDRGYDARLLFVDRDLDKVIRQSGIEVAFIALHGRFGEDGCVQGMLELMGIPYTGSSVLASSLAMHKVKAKELFRLHNVPTPPYYVVTADQLAELEDVHGSFGFPAVVKPVTEGSSVGVAIVSSIPELEKSVAEALRHDDLALVERYAKGKEVSVAVLDGRVLGAVEIQPRGEFYDYDSKYTNGGSQYFIPARLSQPRYQGVLNLARKAALALGCSAVCRVDLIVTEGDNEYVLEVNTLPGMTPTSLVPKLAASAGMDFGDLCENILLGARLHVARHAPRSFDLPRRDSGDAWESRARMLT